MGLFDFFKGKSKNAISAIISSDKIEMIVEQLDKLGYFKYTAQEDVEELKSEVLNSLRDSSYLSTIWNEAKPFNSKDYRHYSLDGETLFEQDGFRGYLKDFEHLFDIIGFKLDISNHVEDWDEENKWLNHSITINNKDYTIFSNFKGYGWGEAAERFAEILNDQLILQGKDERIYLAGGGNDGFAVVLTEEQFSLLDPILKHPTSRPLRTMDWCKIMQVEPA